MRLKSFFVIYGPWVKCTLPELILDTKDLFFFRSFVSGGSSSVFLIFFWTDISTFTAVTSFTSEHFWRCLFYCTMLLPYFGHWVCLLSVLLQDERTWFTFILSILCIFQMSVDVFYRTFQLTRTTLKHFTLFYRVPNLSYIYFSQCPFHSHLLFRNYLGFPEYQSKDLHCHYLFQPLILRVASVVNVSPIEFNMLLLFKLHLSSQWLRIFAQAH